MANQTPATIATLKTFTEAAVALIADAQKVAATKDASAIETAAKTATDTFAKVEKALEPND